MAASLSPDPIAGGPGGTSSTTVASGSDLAPAGDAPPALEVHELTKVYPGTVALREFEFMLRPGEVRAVLGKNGAGKSTFVEILSGTMQADGGRVIVAGRPATIASPLAARAVGIATVHQEPSLFPALSVAENLTLGRAARRGIVSAREQLRQARTALDLIHVSLPLNRPAGSLTIRDQQLVAIARALSFDPHVLILDEPTSALSYEQIDHLLELVARLARQGVAVIYVSHRLDEIPRVAHSVTVLRDGALVGTLPIGEAPPATIVEMMLGRAQVREVTDLRDRGSGPVALSVRDVHLDRRLDGVSLDLNEGEVMGLWGMPGAGRSELLRGIFGLEHFTGGRVLVRGVLQAHPAPRSMIHAGVAFSPDDRKREGLVLGLSIAENLVMASQQKVSQAGVISGGRLRALAWSVVRRLSIKTPTIDQPVHSLSGGNQQKVVIGKWLAADSRILLMDEPTRGVDVEAKASLYGLLRQLSAAGRSVLLAPTELEELFLACDRIVVLRRGRVVGEMVTAHATPAAVMALAMGG
jgi:ABC-type sugar transport system ATPase subunit